MIDKINILGLIYNVIYNDRVHIGRDEVAGVVNPDNLTIEISSVTHPDRQRQSLFHEMVHAILWEVDRSKYHDEDFVNRIATSLYQVFSANPQLSELFIEKLDINTIAAPRSFKIKED